MSGLHSAPSPADATTASRPLFDAMKLGSLTLRNRVVMAPMTRSKSPGGVPGQNVVEYYRRRAEGGVGLIIGEGSWIPHSSASNDDNVPRFYGAEALDGWRQVIGAVHAAGAKMFPQLWHVGQVVPYGASVDPESANGLIGPSGFVGGMGIDVQHVGIGATLVQIHEIITAYGNAATSAKELGFDGVEIHGAHGYLIDQFLWKRTNHRTDEYGVAQGRTKFAGDVVREVRQRVGADFTISMRLSTWKSQDFGATLAESPEELADLVGPLSEAGVDLFHLSERRFWEGSFGTNLNLAGWVKRITGKPTISVGSVTLHASVTDTIEGVEVSPDDNLSEAEARLARGEFDLLAVGRSMIANPDWVHRVREGKALRIFNRSMLGSLD
jgi:2,4-dienoyl-CoA reductase-like NADH-dependent reductase (Old Yellow Enzyme family)